MGSPSNSIYCNLLLSLLSSFCTYCIITSYLLLSKKNVQVYWTIKESGSESECESNQRTRFKWRWRKTVLLPSWASCSAPPVCTRICTQRGSLSSAWLQVGCCFVGFFFRCFSFVIIFL